MVGKMTKLTELSERLEALEAQVRELRKVQEEYIRKAGPQLPEDGRTEARYDPYAYPRWDHNGNRVR